MTGQDRYHGGCPVGGGASGGSPHLVAIAPRGSDTPIYCIHPSGGTVFCYVGLARLLGPDHPIYGFKVAEDDSAAHCHRTVEEMAACYLDAVECNRPPIFLAWSFGGAVAFEMARMATIRGTQPRALILLDTPGPGFVPPARTDAEVLFGLLGKRAPARPEDISAAGDPEAQLHHLVNLCRRAGIYDAAVSTQDLRRLISIHQRNNEAARAYNPNRYDGRLFLFRPTGDSIFGGTESDLTLGWSRVADGGVDVAFVPGEHLEMLSPPSLAPLSERLCRLLATPGAAA